MPRLLLVDDEKDLLEVARRYFEAAGFECRQAQSAEEGLALLKAEPFDAVLMDVQLPGATGLRALESFAAETPAPILLMTGHADPELERDALLLGAKALLAKPLDLPAVRARVKELARR